MADEIIIADYIDWPGSAQRVDIPAGDQPPNSDPAIDARPIAHHARRQRVVSATSPRAVANAIRDGHHTFSNIDGVIDPATGTYTQRRRGHVAVTATPPDARPTSAARRDARRSQPKLGNRGRPLGRPVGSKNIPGENTTQPNPSRIREPWRFNAEQRLDAPDIAPTISSLRTRPYGAPMHKDQLNSKATFDQAERAGVVSRAGAGTKYPKRLVARARELGLPLTEYDSSLSMAIRLMDGGRDSFLRFVQLAAADGDDDAIKFMTGFSELRRLEQSSVSFDLLCLTCGVSPVMLLKSVVGVAFDTGVDTANLVAAAAHPMVVARTIESAKRIDSDMGLKDRHALLAHHGFLPTSKGTTVNVTASAQAAAAVTSADASVPKFLGAASTAAAAREAVQRELSAGVPAAQDGDVLDVQPTAQPFSYEDR